MTGLVVQVQICKIVLLVGIWWSGLCRWTKEDFSKDLMDVLPQTKDVEKPRWLSDHAAILPYMCNPIFKTNFILILET